MMRYATEAYRFRLGCFEMGRPRSQAAHEKVLEATASIALADGLAAVTIDEVARRSGVAKTTIYRHFEHRNALLIAALDRTTDAPDRPDTGSLAADLAAFYRDLVPIFEAPDVRTLSLEIFAAAARDPELDGLRTAFFAGRMGPLEAILRQAAARGEIEPIRDPLAAIEIVHGPLIVRSLIAPATLDALDPDALAASAAARLTTLHETANVTP